LRTITGPQEDAFTEAGLSTFYSSEYVISNASDRMGYRMEGPVIAHKRTADIISDATCLGSVQAPGHGQPIAMLADRQTTGGYAKIATICAVDVENLAQRLPGQKVRFVRVSVSEAVALLREEEALLAAMKTLFMNTHSMNTPVAGRGTWNVTVDGEAHRVKWERLE
jgi:allophanate hydrolase subunit 2